MPSVKADREWEGWAADWKEGTPPLPNLERKVRRQGRLRALGAAGGLLAGLGFLALAAERALARPDPHVVVWAGAVWGFVLVLTTFLFTTHRGTWRPAAATTREFLAISRRRCLANLRVVRFTRWFLLAELIFVALWSAWVTSAAPSGPLAALRAGALRYALTLLFATGALVWLRWYGLRNRAELARLQEIERDLVS